MAAWVELTNGIFVNMTRIEGVVPDGPRAYKFFPPRAQRGGRPTGRPTQRIEGYDEDRNFWHGIPKDPEAMLQVLRGSARATLIDWVEAAPDAEGSARTGSAGLGTSRSGRHGEAGVGSAPSQKPQDGVAPPAAPRVGSDPDAA